MRDDREYHICKQIAEYLRHQYPKVVFHFDYAGMKHTKAEAGRMKAIQGDRGFPDLFIAEPMMFAGGKGYSGLFIEVKAETPFKKDGSLFKQKQILYKEFGGRRVAVGSEKNKKKATALPWTRPSAQRAFGAGGGGPLHPIH